MIINLSPQRRDDAISVVKSADILTINGEVFDFTALPDGATIPAGEVPCPWIVGPVHASMAICSSRSFCPWAVPFTGAGLTRPIVDHVHRRSGEHRHRRTEANSGPRCASEAVHRCDPSPSRHRGQGAAIRRSRRPSPIATTRTPYSRQRGRRCSNGVQLAWRIESAALSKKGCIAAPTTASNSFR